MPCGQATQTTPPVPQNWSVLPWRQVLPSQQPLEQLAVVHTHEPFWHCVPAGQVTQTAPPVPQCSLLLVWQTPFWQQPFGQLAAVHTHEPF